MSYSQLALVAGSGIFMFQDELKAIGANFLSAMSGFFVHTLSIKDPHTMHCIRSELKDAAQREGRPVTLIDKSGELTMPTGTYWVHTVTDKIFLSICVEDHVVTVSTPRFNDSKILLLWKDTLLKKYEQEYIAFYLADGSDWGYPKYRRRQKIENIGMTPELERILEDSTNFLATEEQEKATHVGPYKRAYLITGKKGSGKTLAVRYLAQVHKLPVYEIYLSRDMKDRDLVKLFVDVPPHSIIVIDELDKQLARVGTAKNDLTTASLLTGIDGTIGLNHGVIVILIASDKSSEYGFWEGIDSTGED